jgi:hypothetical protein
MKEKVKVVGKKRRPVKKVNKYTRRRRKPGSVKVDSRPFSKKKRWTNQPRKEKDSSSALIY